MSKYLQGLADTPFNYTQESTSSLLKMEHLMQAVFMDTVVRTEYQEADGYGKGKGGMKCLSFIDDQEKKRK